MVLNGGFPWAMPVAPGTPRAAALIRRRARPLLVRAYPPVLRPAAAVAMTLAWPVRSFLAVRAMMQRLPADAFPGRPRSSLFRAAWWMALRHNIPPLEYFAFRMPDAPKVPPDAWLVQTEMPRLAESLATQEARRCASDKHAFWEFCRDRGLPAIPTLARSGFAGEGPDALPDAVVLKPRRGANARGVELWRVEGGRYRRAGSDAGEAAALDARGLLGHLDAVAAVASEEYLLQPCLDVHPGLAAAASSGVPAARIVTGLWPGGEVEPLWASFFRPRPGSVASNGGARRRIDLGTGVLRPAEIGQHRSIFPDSDLAPELDDLVLPDWPRALAAARAAHGAFPGRAVLIGWDVAFTLEGPVLIEANLGTSLFLLQADSLAPAGQMPVADVVAAWLT